MSQTQKKREGPAIVHESSCIEMATPLDTSAATCANGNAGSGAEKRVKLENWVALSSIEELATKKRDAKHSVKMMDKKETKLFDGNHKLAMDFVMKKIMAGEKDWQAILMRELFEKINVPPFYIGTPSQQLLSFIMREGHEECSKGENCPCFALRQIYEMQHTKVDKAQDSFPSGIKKCKERTQVLLNVVDMFVRKALPEDQPLFLDEKGDLREWCFPAFDFDSESESEDESSESDSSSDSE